MDQYKQYKISKAQGFTIDPSTVNNATEVGISAIFLYCRLKPDNNPDFNASGIRGPGVEVSIVPIINGIPDVSYDAAYYTSSTDTAAFFYSKGRPARVEWSQIEASTDAVPFTKFVFPFPYYVKTNQQYAILIKIDGSDEYYWWEAIPGQQYVGSTSVFNTSLSQNVGKLFDYIAPVGWPYAYSDQNWSPRAVGALKFQVLVAQFLTNGSLYWSPDSNQITPVRNVQVQNTVTGVVTVVSQADPLEFCVFDKKTSTIANLHYGDAVFQLSPSYPGNKITNGVADPLTISVKQFPTFLSIGNNALTYKRNSGNLSFRTISANTSYTYANGASFTASGGFNNIFPNFANSYENDTYIVVQSGNSYNVRQVLFVNSTQIIVNRPFTFTNTTATFFKSPIGFIKNIENTYYGGKLVDLLTLFSSSANLDVRFVNNSISSLSLISGGSGYNNTDYIKVIGFESISLEVYGGYYAYANIITDSNGAISNLFLSNIGAGYVNTAQVAIQILNANNTVSAGNGANISYIIGTTLQSEYSLGSGVFTNCEFINIDMIKFKPSFILNTPLGTSCSIQHETLFYKQPSANTFSGFTYLCQTPVQQALFEIDTVFNNYEQPIDIDITKLRSTLPSRSNQFAIRYNDGTVPNTTVNLPGGSTITSITNIIGRNASNASVFFFNYYSNNDFQMPFLDPGRSRQFFSSFITNQSSLDEQLSDGSGESHCRHITTQISLANTHLAEDLFVTLTAYKPPNTDISVYARIHNSADPEAFDDKQWTKLLVDDNRPTGISLNSYYDYTYTFPFYSDIDITLDGSASVSQGNDIITMVGTGSANLLVTNTFWNFNPQQVANFVYIGNTNLKVNDRVFYLANTGNTAPTGLVNATSYYIYSVNSSGVGLSATWEGPILAISNAGAVNETGHYLFKTTLNYLDTVRIYHPTTPNYFVVAMVNTVINASSFRILKIFGDLSANLAGTVSVNTTAAIVTGTSTTFNTDFITGSYIGVWANDDFYQIKKVISITNSTYMNVESAWIFTNATSNYGDLVPSTFNANDVDGDGYKVDKFLYNQQTYKDPFNSNIASYYSDSLALFKGFSRFQLKIVLLSNDSAVVPRIESLRGIATSA